MRRTVTLAVTFTLTPERLRPLIRQHRRPASKAACAVCGAPRRGDLSAQWCAQHCSPYRYITVHDERRSMCGPGPTPHRQRALLGREYTSRRWALSPLVCCMRSFEYRCVRNAQRGARSATMSGGRQPVNACSPAQLSYWSRRLQSQPCPAVRALLRP